MATALQTESPLQPGYVSVAAPDGVPCAIRQIPKEWKEISWATLLLPAGLRPGQEITVSFGSEPHPCHVIAHKYPYAPVSWRVDYEGEGEFYRLWPPMVIRVAPDRAAKLGLVAPSVLAPGEPVAVKGRVEDRNSNIGARYEKPIALTLERNGEPVPGCTRAVRAGERGTFGFAGWAAGESGLYRVRARAEGLPEAVSNAAQVVENPDHRVFWGDCHNHTMWADGCHTIDDNFLYARDEAFLDVFGLSEHINNNEAFDTYPQLKPGTDWSLLGPHMADATRRYHEPRRFVTILGAEYSPSFKTKEPKGDFCIFSPSDCFGDVPMAQECPDMLAQAKAQGCVCVPHVGGHILPWEHFPVDTGVVPLLEIAAMHGHFERFAQEALQRGYRLGFVGMSDGHFGMPGYDNWSQHGRTPNLRHRNYSSQSAITGFLAGALTREEIFRAMRARRTYATSGQRILLDVRLAGFPMGSEVTLNSPPCLHVEAHGTAPVARVDIIRGDRRVMLWERGPDGRQTDPAIDWRDPAPVPGETWYYVRVTQEDFSLAWSSPIWVKYTGEPPPRGEALPAWNDPPYWPPERPETCDPAHAQRLDAILRKRGIHTRFVDLRPIGLFAEPRGRFAMFLARDAELNKPVHIYLYVDFEDDRLYVFEGYADYGDIYKWE
jgi:hypothetical protein